MLNRAIKSLRKTARRRGRGRKIVSQTHKRYSSGKKGKSLAPPEKDGNTLAALERIMISRALDTADGNQSQASRILGISRDTLRYKIKKHDLKTFGSFRQA